MSLPVEKITEYALSLNSDARALLADRLVESLDPIDDEEIRAAWAAEAQRRLADLRAGKVVAIPADEVLAHVLSLQHLY